MNVCVVGLRSRVVQHSIAERSVVNLGSLCLSVLSVVTKTSCQLCLKVWTAVIQENLWSRRG